jgi:hypothetical protein
MVNDERVRSRDQEPKLLAAAAVERLPPSFDRRAVEDCLTTHLDAFRASDSLFKEFMIALRARYHTRWELQLLKELKDTLNARIDAMEAGITYNVTRATHQEQTDTKIIQARTAYERARQEYAKVQSEAPHTERLSALEADNKVLAAQLANEALKRKLSGKDKREPQDDLQAVRERTRREEQRKQAADSARAETKIQWREELTRQMNAKIAAVQADPTYTADDKAALIDEIKDEYAQLLARDI